jgi:hypothetical protein
MKGKLNGTPPTIFDGDRTKAQDFMREFNLYWMQNDQHPMMTTPYYRMTTCLARIRGPKVNDWVDQVIREVQQGLTDGSSHRQDDRLWTEFKESFEGQFTDTAIVEKSLTELTNLDLTGDDVDSYIAKFETLVRRCGYLRTDPGVLKMFKDGLPKGVTSKIYSRDVWPLTLDEWQAAVRCEIRRRKIVMAEVGKPGEWNTSTREARWKAALTLAKSPR